MPYAPRSADSRRHIMNQNSLAVPIAIVIAAALIAGAIYMGSRDARPAPQSQTDIESSEIVMRPVDESDHIRGNPNAPILLVEYSDYDCPFCSQFHVTMQRVMDKYGTTGEVAWVYRHFPISQLHPNAMAIAAASECVAELGGNEAFWTFSDLIFDEKPIEVRNGQEYVGSTDMSRLPEFAEAAGVSPSAFNACRESGRYDDAIRTAVTEAQDAGGTGTPHTLIVAGNEVIGQIPGAYPFENFRDSSGNVRSGVDEIIAEILRQIPSLPAQRESDEVQ